MRFWIKTLAGLMVITLLIGWAANSYYIDQRISFASERLLLLNQLRREALHRYLDTTEAEIRFWSLNPELISQQLWLVDAWNEAVEKGRDPEQALKRLYIDNNPHPAGERNTLVDAGDDSGYSKLHATLHPMARRFVTERGYYDLFLISPTGDIFYTVEKEADYGSNLHRGPFKSSGLAKVFQLALSYAETDGVALSDIAPYEPSGGSPAMFAAKAMYGPDGQLAGVIALQIPTERIIDIMNFDAGMGTTGETYLVGEDLLMRSDSRFKEESTILRQKVDTATVQAALQGDSGVRFASDYRDTMVLSAYSSTRVGENTWAIMAEVDKSEILENATSDRPLLAGLMLFFYSFAAWSVWFIRRADFDVATSPLLSDLDLGGDRDMTDG